MKNELACLRNILCSAALLIIGSGSSAQHPAAQPPIASAPQSPAVQPPDLDTDSLVAPGAMPRLISAQFSFTEGATVDKKGNVFFTDQPNNRIWRYSTSGELSLWLDSAGRSNGMYFDRKGNLISCADEKDQLWSISPDKKIKVLVSGYQGRLLNGPNDCWVAPGGGIYMTDPYYQRSYWTRTKPDLDSQKVYYLAKGAKELIPAAGGLMQPNGIVGTPDGKYLYVADIRDSRTWVYSILRDGSLTDRRLAAPQGSDGITLDEKGNLYLTGNGVTVYDPSGKKIAHIPVPAKWTANLCFGGKDKRDLFITASESFFVIRMRVKGVEEAAYPRRPSPHIRRSPPAYPRARHVRRRAKASTSRHDE